MTKKQGEYTFRQGYECPRCKKLMRRRADLKQHLVGVHGLGAEQALEIQRGALQALEEVTSVRSYPALPDRYRYGLPEGTEAPDGKEVGGGE